MQGRPIDMSNQLQQFVTLQKLVCCGIQWSQIEFPQPLLAGTDTNPSTIEDETEEGLTTV